MFKSLSRTVTCTGELSAFIRVTPRGKRLSTPCLDYHTWYSRGPVIATPSGRREKGRYSGRGRYSSIATSSRYIG